VEFLGDLVKRLTVDREVDLRLLSWFTLTDLSEDNPTELIKSDGTGKLTFDA